MQGARFSWLLIFWTWDWSKCIKKRLVSIWHGEMMASLRCVHMLLQTAVTIKKTCQPQTMWRIHAHKNSKLRSWPHHDSKQKPESEAEARPLFVLSSWIYSAAILRTWMAFIVTHSSSRSRRISTLDIISLKDESPDVQLILLWMSHRYSHYSYCDCEWG